MKKWNIGWGPIARCNMNCAFCYSKFKREENFELEIDDWKKFIDENYEKINSINYGTGENTLDKNWFVLVKYIRDNYPHITQSLTTNGNLSKMVKNSSECLSAFVSGIDEVDVSLDFADKEKHTALRGNKFAYDMALETLALCKEYKKRATIVFIGSKKTLYKENIDGIFAIGKKYGAVLRMNIFRPTQGIDEKAKEFIATYDMIKEALMYINEKYSIISLGDTLFSTVLAGETRQDPSGDMSIRILADGSITPSTYLISGNFCVGNIKDENVLSKLEETLQLSSIIHKVIPKSCEKCVYANECAGGVFDRRYLWYGTLEEKDPYCQGPYLEKIKPIVKVVDYNLKSVHEDYLPTIFFLPYKV